MSNSIVAKYTIKLSSKQKIFYAYKIFSYQYLNHKTTGLGLYQLSFSLTKYVLLPLFFHAIHTKKNVQSLASIFCRLSKSLGGEIFLQSLVKYNNSILVQNFAPKFRRRPKKRVFAAFWFNLSPEFQIS